MRPRILNCIIIGGDIIVDRLGNGGRAGMKYEPE